MLDWIVPLLLLAVGIPLAAFAALLLFLLFASLKKQLQHLSPDDWDAYFRRLSARALLGRMLLFYGLGLVPVSLFCFGILHALGHPHPAGFAVCFIAAGLGYALVEFRFHWDELQSKLERLHRR